MQAQVQPHRYRYSHWNLFLCTFIAAFIGAVAQFLICSELLKLIPFWLLKNDPVLGAILSCFPESSSYKGC